MFDVISVKKTNKLRNTNGGNTESSSQPVSIKILKDFLLRVDA